MSFGTLARVGAAALALPAHAAVFAQPCEPHWVERFPAADLSSYVSALTVIDDGSGNGPALYAGGGFIVAGNQGVNHVARFDGNTWSGLGDGFNASVFTFLWFDDGSGPALYAGGSFTASGEAPVNRIARWDGSSWSPVGSGFSYTAYDLAVFDDGLGDGPSLYAAGSFAYADGHLVNHVARWNGTSWEALGAGTDKLVVSLAVFDDGSGGGLALYAGGYFTTAGDNTAPGIAKWDGKSWSDVGGGADGFIEGLAVFDDGTGPALYAAGGFTTIGGVEASNTAKWDGTAWSPLGSGTDGYVICLATIDVGRGPALYAGGLFESAGGKPVNFIARWDGSNWSALGTGMEWLVYALAEFDDGSGEGPALYAGGYFDSADDVEAEHIARWDGSAWSALGNGLNDEVAALTVFDDGSGTGSALYVGGWFSRAGGIAADLITRWDGSEWSVVGEGLAGWAVIALTQFDEGFGSGPQLFAGGGFMSPGGGPGYSLARWDNPIWSPVGGDLGGAVYEMAVFDDGSGSRPALYLGGRFSGPEGVPAHSIARWDGTAMSALGMGTNGDVWALAVFDDRSGSGPQLYVGGTFGAAGNIAGPYIGRWDGTEWSPVGSGFDGCVYGCDGYVSELAVYDDGNGPSLYAGGLFELDDVDIGLAKWDGIAWTPVGAGATGPVFSMIVVDDGIDDHPALYVGGRFLHADGVPVRGIARWNGSSWSALGDGVQSLPAITTRFGDRRCLTAARQAGRRCLPEEGSPGPAACPQTESRSGTCVLTRRSAISMATRSSASMTW
jgi:hypothetical protein